MNKELTTITSNLIKNKLARTTVRLQQATSSNGNPTFSTLESASFEATKILTGFFKNLSGPTYEPITVYPDTPPDKDLFNNNIQGILDDLNIVFAEFENLETVILGNFNYMITRLNRLNHKLKTVSSKLADFALYSNSPTKNGVFFGDSFNNLSRVEFNSPLLNEKQCEINQVEGIATLPIDRESQVAINITEIPVINSNSNGVRGNNEELNAVRNSNISTILDNNADTWFEYERVVREDDGIALILDFTVNLGDPKIINFIRVNPNNFGTRTQIEILEINTSLDGNDFVSIKDDIPISGFITEDEANIFTLAPSTSKYAGQGLYTFTPRKAKYVNFSLRQKTPYFIETSSGQKYRYAIGLRDIHIEALPYFNTGEVISSEYQLTEEIKKVILLSNQKPVVTANSELASISHFVSPDNGITWYPIRARNTDGESNQDQTIPELLNFNTVDLNSVTTTSNVKTLRYKAVLNRNTDAFTSESPELAQEISSKTELHTPPTTTPFELQLQNQPIENSIKLIDPQLGSRGKVDVHYKIALGNGNKQILYLPFKPLKRDLTKSLSGGSWNLLESDPEQIFVGNEQWSRSLSSSSTSSSKHYSLNYETGKLEFGDGTTGKAPPSGSVISMLLSEEQIYPSRGADHIALLDYPTSNDKKQLEISIVHPNKTDRAVLKRGAKRHELKPFIVDDTEILNPDPGDKVSFIDGETEFAVSGHYSLDLDNGILYLKNATSSLTESSISYKYTPKTILDEDDWEFVDSENSELSTQISINDSTYLTFEADTLTIPNNVKYFNLEHFGIVRGSLSFIDTSTSDTPTSLANEVEYIDGRSELLGVIYASEQIASFTGITSGDIKSFSFGMKVTTDTSFAVTFSDTDVFSNEQTYIDGSSELSSIGDYSINRSGGTTGTIYVKLSGNVSDPGIVNYYYIDPQANLTGRYSVNYETGEIFCYTATNSTSTVDYEYTNYKVKYDIARLVPLEDWDYNPTSNKITIKDREILKNIRIPQTLGSNAVSSSKYYQIVYNYISKTRADVLELEPYFSPVLKDYSLKVITKSGLL